MVFSHDSIPHELELLDIVEKLDESRIHLLRWHHEKLGPLLEEYQRLKSGLEYSACRRISASHGHASTELDCLPLLTAASSSNLKRPQFGRPCLLTVPFGASHASYGNGVVGCATPNWGATRNVDEGVASTGLTAARSFNEATAIASSCAPSLVGSKTRPPSSVRKFTLLSSRDSSVRNSGMYIASSCSDESLGLTTLGGHEVRSQTTKGGTWSHHTRTMKTAFTMHSAMPSRSINGRARFMRNIWLKQSKLTKEASVQRLSGSSMSLDRGSRVYKHTAGLGVSAGKKAVLILPNSTFHMFWSLVAAALLLYDFISIPVEVVFEEAKIDDVRHPRAYARLLALAYWTVDMPLNFMTATIRDGTLITDCYDIAASYLKSWMFFDVFLLLVDWLNMLDMMTGASGLPLLRTFRVLRLAKLLRLLKIRKLMICLSTAIPPSVLIFGSVLRTQFSLLVALHLISCAWCAIGLSSGEHGWIQLRAEGVHVGTTYAAALHWTVAQFHGTAGIYPGNNLEYCFSAVVAYLCFLASLVLVARITSVVLVLADTADIQMFQRCRQYLNAIKVSPTMSFRMRHVMDNNLTKRGLGEVLQRQNEIVKILPEIVQVDLLEELRTPLVNQILFFSELRAEHGWVIRELCHKAISNFHASKLDVLFRKLASCSRVLFVEIGTFVYTHNGQIDQEMLAAVERMVTAERRFQRSTMINSRRLLERGRYVSEPVLWTNWEHRGELFAITEGVLLALGIEEFEEVMEAHPIPCAIGVRHAKRFVRHLQSQDDPGAVPDLMTSQAIPQNNDAVVDYEGHLMFLSHYKQESGTEATLILEGMTNMIHGHPAHFANDLDVPIFLDSENLSDISTICEYVKNSRNVLLLLTDNVLQRPWCLLEIVTALLHGIPVIPVAIERAGINFRFPDEEYYSRLRAGEVLNTECVQLLDEYGVSLADVENALKHVFMSISLSFSPHKAVKYRQLELREILLRCTDGGMNAWSHASHAVTASHEKSCMRAATDESDGEHLVFSTDSAASA